MAKVNHHRKNNTSWIPVSLIFFVLMLIFASLYASLEAKIEVGDLISEDIEGVTHTYVYLGASSKVYLQEDGSIEHCLFVETEFFSDPAELSELIDEGGFPYKTEYTATTSARRDVRYKIRTDSGSSYWVEP